MIAEAGALHDGRHSNPPKAGDDRRRTLPAKGSTPKARPTKPPAAFAAAVRVATSATASNDIEHEANVLSDGVEPHPTDHPDILAEIVACVGDDTSTLAAMSRSSKAMHAAAEATLKARKEKRLEEKRLEELRKGADSVNHVCEYWASQQGTGHRRTSAQCPSCGGRNCGEYDGTRTSYDYCNDCGHKWNFWYD